MDSTWFNVPGLWKRNNIQLLLKITRSETCRIALFDKMFREYFVGFEFPDFSANQRANVQYIGVWLCFDFSANIKKLKNNGNLYRMTVASLGTDTYCNIARNIARNFLSTWPHVTFFLATSLMWQGSTDVFHLPNLRLNYEKPNRL